MDQDPDDEREARIVADMEIPPELCGYYSCVFLPHRSAEPHSWEVNGG